jgi:glycosyltransferase involved in cell wall biosynthesis
MNRVDAQSETPGKLEAPKSVRPIRLAYFVSHPIQYQAPLLRRIADEPDIDLTAFFSSDVSVRGYVDSGFRVRVEWDVPLLEGYKYEFLPRIRETDHPGFTRPLNWGILSRLRKGRFDAVWVFGYDRLSSLNAILAARLLGLPVILQGESNLGSRKRSKLVRAVKRVIAPLLKNSISCVVPIGKLNEKYWRHYLGEDFSMFPMPYSVDNEFFSRRSLEAEPHRQDLCRELDLETDRPVILFASKLQTRKRCIDLVEAYIRLCPGPGIDPHAYLLIVGDGEERQNLEARVRNSGLSSIRFLGFRNQTELPSIYNLCDVFVLPSVHETWGLIVNEVMNAGRAVIVTDRVGCQPDLVHDGFNGFVVPVSDVEVLAERLRRLIADPELRKSMGANSRRLIHRYSYDRDIAGLRQALTYSVRNRKRL